MTFGDMIKTMNVSKVFGCTRDMIAIDLLMAAGIVLKPDQQLETTVTKWIDRKTPDKMGDYFPDRTINEAEVLKYIKRCTAGDKWIKLKSEFNKYNTKAIIGNRSKSIVDCETEDSAVFYSSFLLQFPLSLGLPLPENADTYFHTRTPAKIMEELVVSKPLQHEFIQESELNPGDCDSDISISQRKKTGATLAIPSQYKRCVYCAKWGGNTDDAHRNATGAFGFCTMYNHRQQLSTGGTGCISYEPNYAEITDRMISST